MLALVLLGGLLLSSTTAAPNLCSGSCDDSKFGGSAYGRRSSYSSLSSMGSSRGYSTGGSSLGSRGGRLETLDDNVVQTFGSGLNLDRPGNWNEKKHIVTDDGHGEMNYEAGQTVTGNGYSKFSKHSYRYGSQDKHEPRSDSQILSVSDFNNEVQNLRQRINSFMGSYRSDSASLIDAGFMRDFRGKADLISSQLNDVCDQVSKGSSQWNQMQRMIKDFESQYEQKRSELQTRYQQQLESRYSGSSSSSSGGSYHSESSYHQEQRHEYPKEVPPLEPLIKPSFPSESQIRQEQQERIISEERVLQQQHQQQQQQQRVQQKLRSCQDLVREFYREFNRADTSEQYQQQLNTRSELIREKLAELKLEAGQREQQLSEVTTLEAQFGSFVGQLRERIHKFEAQQREEEQRYQERLRQIEEDKRRDEERLRQLESRQEEERRKQAQLEQQKLRLEQQRLQLEKEARETQERLESERIQVEQIEKNRSEKQQRLESERAQLLQQQRKMQQQLQQPVPTPELPDVEIVGTDSDLRKQHSSSSSQGSSSSTFEASYNMSSSSSSSSTMHVESSGNSGSSSSANLQRQQQQQQQQQQQRVIEPHVDMTARVSRLQQDLNRLNNEINAFKIQSAQLSSENSISVVPQLNGQAESLRKEIQGLCDKSERYHSDDALQNARELKARFEAEFGRFQSSLSELSSSSSFTSSSSSSSNQQEMQQVQQQLGDFSSGSSWSSSGRVSHVKPPRLTKMELEHSRSVEVEMGSRPAPVIGSRSSYSGSSGYSASSSYGSAGGSAGESSSRYSSDCVEASAGQPCVGQLQHQRHRRQVPGN